MNPFDRKCKWCGGSLPFGMVATCFNNPNGLWCEAEDDSEDSQEPAAEDK